MVSQFSEVLYIQYMPADPTSATTRINIQPDLFFIYHFCSPPSNADQKCALPCFSTACSIPNTVIHTFDYAILTSDFFNWIWTQRNGRNVTEFSASLILWMDLTNTSCEFSISQNLEIIVAFKSVWRFTLCTVKETVHAQMKMMSLLFSSVELRKVNLATFKSKWGPGC